ncbi:MAG TPA: hypothetical protein DHW64_13890 [Chitinophagaceae bacterium]|nr:hypothetical protein [Chitinophagaceae bacterium]
MRKIYIVLFHLVFLSTVLGQEEINNKKTAQHQLVTGTKIFIVPPANFIAATNFHGFQQAESGASIMVVEIPAPFVETSAGFDEAGFQKQRMLLKLKQTININGNQGLLITVEQAAYGIMYSKYILTFGAGKTTQLINAIFPKEATALGADMLKSILSVVYEPQLTVNPNSSLFSIDVTDTKLKLAKNMSGTLLYTTDGNVPPQSEDKTSFIVSPSLDNMYFPDKKQAFIERMKKLPYRNLSINENSIKEVTIDGIGGYEFISEGISMANNSGQNELVYQVMLFADNAYYLMIGNAKTDYENNTLLFQKIARTFKKK